MTKFSKVDVVGVGLNATDTVIPVIHYPASGSKVEIRSANMLLGGQLATAIMACQHWGLRTCYVGKIGDDHAAALHRAEFARAGVEVHLLAAPGCASQQAFILVDDAGERTVLWKRDDRLTLRPEELDREWIINSRSLHVDGHDTAAATAAAGWARAAGTPVMADLDELYPGVEALLKNVDYLITSRDIPGKLMADDDLRKSLSAVKSRFGCALTASTLGEEGVLAWDGTQFHYAPAFRVHAVDHRRGRHFSRGIHLWSPARLAGPAPTRFCLCRRRLELHRHRRPRRHPIPRNHRAPHAHRRSALPCFRHLDIDLNHFLRKRIQRSTGRTHAIS